jgi:hypothetical protein
MGKKIFKDFDFSNFWDDSDYAFKTFVEKYPNDELIISIEEELGYKLPDSYIELMKLHNGGIPLNYCHPTEVRTSWAEDHVAIEGIMGIGRTKAYSLCGKIGSQFMIDEWGYPNIGVCICDCPSAGHDMIMLDYTNSGKHGEPEVVHVDQECNYKKTFLAKDFETFIRGLVNWEVYDTSEEDFINDLEKIKTGQFSNVLQSYFKKDKSVDFDHVFRNLFTEITNEKGYFGLYGDSLSYLAYDIQFYLLSKSVKIYSKTIFFEKYPKMVALGNNEINTGGYAPSFIEKWFKEKIKNKQIIKTHFNFYEFTDDYKENLFEKIKLYI